jgi:hypothetical protein
MSHDDDRDESGVGLGERARIDPTGELDDVLEELRAMLKNPDVVGALADRGVNASLALLAIDGLNAYLTGDKRQAADDLKTVGEEIEGRLAFGSDPPLA